LQKIRQLTQIVDFSDELVSFCAATGVAVVYVREIDKSRISGATWWSSPTRAVIQLSDRYKSEITSGSPSSMSSPSTASFKEADFYR
jgi:HTH-type transcriptional regulator/antitoxin HigA